MIRKLGLLCCLLAVGIGLFAQDLRRYSFSSPHMGTTFRIVLYAEDSLQAATVARAAFFRIEELNEKLSDYLPDSELNRLSATAGSGEFVPVSEELWTVLLASRFYSRKSKGAFDVSIGPLSRLWRRAMRKAAFPEADKLEKARSLLGWKSIKLRKASQRVKLKKAGMKLDLGGIAKGYAVDEVFAILQEAGFKIALVDGGGDLLLGDPPPGKEGWTIEVPAYSFPEDEKKDLLVLNNCSVATSGDTYRYIELEGVRYSHIIDPRSGLGISKRRMLTVIASTGITADALASVFSIVGKEDEQRIRKKYKDASLKVRLIEWP
ncbi:MAG: FAD:protein FMN transferase [Bacteroidia bacterium]|nr:FAD:protein FMN transferase [Bacteroidia bacterium]